MRGQSSEDFRGGKKHFRGYYHDRYPSLHICLNAQEQSLMPTADSGGQRRISAGSLNGTSVPLWWGRQVTGRLCMGRRGYGHCIPSSQSCHEP